jgi:hypothetical protein
MKPNKGPRRVLGLRLPYVMATVADVGEKAAKLIADVVADPRRAIKAQIEGIRDTLDEERRRACDAAVGVGNRLLWLRLNPGDDGFAKHVAQTGMSPRTARNKMALALFAEAHPELYERLKILGPTKLYRIAVLNPATIWTISVDDPVETPRGKIPLRQLTSREFEAWLKAQMPPAKHESWIRRAHRRLRQSRGVLERNAGQAIDPGEVVLLWASYEEFGAWLKETLKKPGD